MQGSRWNFSLEYFKIRVCTLKYASPMGRPLRIEYPAPPAMDMWITRKREFPTSPRHNNNDSLSRQHSMVDPICYAET